MQKIERSGLERNECFLDDDGILRIVDHGVSTEGANKTIADIIIEVSKKFRAEGKPVLVIVDVTDMIRSTFRARQQAAKDSKRVDIDGLCYVVGKNSYGRMLLKIALRLFDQNKFHGADTVEEARLWLFDYKSRNIAKNNGGLS